MEVYFYAVLEEKVDGSLFVRKSMSNPPDLRAGQAAIKVVLDVNEDFIATAFPVAVVEVNEESRIYIGSTEENEI